MERSWINRWCSFWDKESRRINAKLLYIQGDFRGNRKYAALMGGKEILFDYCEICGGGK